MYLHQKGLDSVIINMANKLELNKISEPEIDILMNWVEVMLKSSGEI